MANSQRKARSGLPRRKAGSSGKLYPPNPLKRKQGKTIVVMVGGGGIGSITFQFLCRILPEDIPVVIIDGDPCEGKNLVRQMFGLDDVDKNKAKALQEKASMALGRKHVRHVPFFLVGVEQLQKLTQGYKTVILIGSVDNHPARVHMEAFAKICPVHCLYVDGANEEWTGEIFAVLKWPGGQQGIFRSQIQPSVLTDKRGDPTQKSCGQELDDGSIQRLVTNAKAAILMVELVGRYLDGQDPVPTGIYYFWGCTQWRPQEE